MRLYGKLVKDAKIIKEAFVEEYRENMAYRDRLETCLIRLCSELDVQVPLWLDKNTSEFIKYRRTIFTSEHFVDKVVFDRLDIKAE